jgi:ParB-like nuclease domain.
VTTDDGEQLGSVFVRTPSVVEVLKPSKRVEYRAVAELTPHPEHGENFTPRDDVIRDCYRNQYAGSFPVVREDGTIINGHKRVAAAELAGLERHPVEVIDVTDDQARELLAIAHRNDDNIDTNTDDTDDS